MKRSEPHITKLMQLGLKAEGYDLPKYGADGQWGSETQKAYDDFVAQNTTPTPDVNNPAEISNCVVDLSHHNKSVDFIEARDSGKIVGVIYKATQGVTYTDGNVGPEPHKVPGIGSCDRDKFNGDLSQLKEFWTS